MTAANRDPNKARETAAAQIAMLQRELAARDERLVEAEARMHQQLARLAAIERSTTWRATAPLRAFGARLPEPMRTALRRYARYAYWLMTPHRIPFRLRWFTHDPVDLAISARLSTRSAELRSRFGAILRRSYGPSAIEELDIYPTARPNAPIFVFVHGGAWRFEPAKLSAFPADMFAAAGVHFVVLEFSGIEETGGDLCIIAEQVRRGIAWAYRHAASFGGDPNRLYVGGHSSGGHLCGVAMVTDWEKDFGLPADIVKGGILMSGLYEMAAVRKAKLSPYIKFTDAMEEAMSPQRHLDLLRAPVIVTCGTRDSPEFRRQSRDFAAAAAAAGKPVELIEPLNLGHMDVAESFGDPSGVNGRAALALMHLSPLISA